MSEMRSSLEFRSNIYPTSTNGALCNDRKFLDAISDPEALGILWHHGGSQGSKLNPLQKKQHEKAMHCAYAEDGDYPWGTLVGTNRVVCLCERVECPRYRVECSKFHPEGFVPGRNPEPSPIQSKAPKRNATEMRSTAASTPITSGKRSSVTLAQEEGPGKPRRSSFSFVTASTVERRSRQTLKATTSPKPHPERAASQRTVRSLHGPWTKREDDILREMYPIHGITVRKWTKALPGRSVEEILDRAHALKVRYVPQRERKDSRGRPKPQVLKSSDAQSKAAKKKHREEMRRRPWDTKEDEILRRNYPKFGANMVDWPQKLKYRTKESIEKRARQLGM